MSATIQILSGLGGKGPAAIVVEAQGKRLLLDAGGVGSAPTSRLPGHAGWT